MYFSAGFLTLPGGTEWFIILLVVVLIFGPKNLPKLGSAIGRFARNLKAGKEGEGIEEEDELPEAPAPKPRRSSTVPDERPFEGRYDSTAHKD
jgi:sec-independent protein translocase protein TatA